MKRPRWEPTSGTASRSVNGPGLEPGAAGVSFHHGGIDHRSSEPNGQNRLPLNLYRNPTSAIFLGNPFGVRRANLDAESGRAECFDDGMSRNRAGSSVFGFALAAKQLDYGGVSSAYAYGAPRIGSARASKIVCRVGTAESHILSVVLAATVDPGCDRVDISLCQRRES